MKVQLTVFRSRSYTRRNRWSCWCRWAPSDRSRSTPCCLRRRPAPGGFSALYHPVSCEPPPSPTMMICVICKFCNRLCAPLPRSLVLSTKNRFLVTQTPYSWLFDDAIRFSPWPSDLLYHFAHLYGYANPCIETLETALSRESSFSYSERTVIKLFYTQFKHWSSILLPLHLSMEINGIMCWII